MYLKITITLPQGSKRTTDTRPVTLTILSVTVTNRFQNVNYKVDLFALKDTRGVVVCRGANSVELILKVSCEKADCWFANVTTVQSIC